MKNLSLAALILFLSALTGSSYADIPLESKDQVQGTWKLDYSKNTATAKESIPREDTWAFKDGKLTITNIPREGTHYDQAPIVYEIENDKLKIPYIGRSGFDTFSLVEKNDKTMILKGKFGEHYYFTKK